MKYKEFLEYLEENLDGYQTFMAKANRYQLDKNANRPKKSRWPQEKMDKVAYDMWKKSMETLYYNLKAEIKSDLACSWTSYIKEHEILESVSESIRELDFLTE